MIDQMRSMLDDATVDMPKYQHAVTPTHGEFIAWGASSGALTGRILDFLSSREDCAGASPAAWTRLNALGRHKPFTDLPGERRSEISKEIIGEQAYRTYVSWVVSMIEASRGMI